MNDEGSITIMATLLHELYSEMIKSGFGKKEALTLTGEYMRALINPAVGSDEK